MNRVSLYTNNSGFDFCKSGMRFSGSIEKLLENDIKFTVNEDDIVNVYKGEIFDIVDTSSVEWIE